MYVCDSVSSYGGQMMVLDPPLEPESQDSCDLMLIIKRVTAKLSLYPPNLKKKNVITPASFAKASTSINPHPVQSCVFLLPPGNKLMQTVFPKS